MFESVFSSILNSTVGTFLKDVGPEQLKVSLGGALHLENVEVKPEAFDFQQLPVAIRHGRVGVLDIQQSWTGLTSRPIKVTLKDLFVVVGVAEDKSVDPEELKERMTKQRLEALMNWEMLRFPEKDAEDQSSGTLKNMIATIIDHITIDIQHVHVMVEGEGLNVGVVIEEIKVFPVNDAEEQVVKCIDTSVYGKRRIEVNNFGIYVNTDPEVLIASTKRFLARRSYAVKNQGKSALQLYDRTREKDDMLPLVSHSKLIRAPTEEYNMYLGLIFQDMLHSRWQYILEPMSIQVRLIMRKKGNAFLQSQTPMQPAMETGVEISSIIFTIQQTQYQSLLRLVSMISSNPMAMTMLAEQLNQDTAVLSFEQQVNDQVKKYMDARGMDIETDKVNPKALGEHVINEFVENLPHHATMLKDAQQYIGLYKQNLLHYTPPTKENIAHMRELEAEYTFGQLIGWRYIAIAIAGYEFKTEEVTWHVKPQTNFFKSLFGGTAKPPKPERVLEDWKLKAVVLFPDHLEDLEIVPRASEGIDPNFPLILADVKLKSLEVALVNDKLEKTHAFKLDGIATKYIMRTNNAQLLFHMESLQAVDFTHTGPYGTWMSTQGDRSFMELDLVMGDKAIDPENNYDMKMNLQVRPVHVTVVPRTISTLSKFFTPPEDLSVGTAAVNAFHDRYVSAKKSMETSVVTSLANRPRMCLDISIAAPLIIIPAIVTKTKQKYHTLYVNIGTLEVKMTPPDMNMVKENNALLSKSKIDNSIISKRSVEEKQSRFFDVYEVHIRDMCVYVKDHTVPKTRNDELVRPFVMTLKANLSLMDDSNLPEEEYSKRQNMPSMVLDLYISPISVVAAPVLTARVLRLGSKVLAELAEAFGEMPKDAVVIEPSTSAHMDQLELIVDYQPAAAEVKQETVNYQAVSLAVMVHVDAFNLEVINDHMFNLPLPVLTFSVKDVLCSLAMRPSDMTAFVVLGSLEVQDHVAMPRNGKQFLLSTGECPLVLPKSSIVSGKDGIDTYGFAMDLMNSILKRHNVQRETAFLTLGYLQTATTSPLHAFADMAVNMTIGTFTLQVNRTSIPTLALFSRQLLPPFPTYEDTVYGVATLDMKVPQFTTVLGIDLHKVACIGNTNSPLLVVEDEGEESKAAERETEFLSFLTNITDDEVDLVFYGFAPFPGRSFAVFTDAQELQARVAKFHDERTLIDELKTEELELSRKVREYIDKKRVEMNNVAVKVTARTATSHDLLRVQQYVNLRTKLVLCKLLHRLQFLDTNVGHFEEKMVVRNAIRDIKKKLLARRTALLQLRQKERENNHTIRAWSAMDQCTVNGGVVVIDPVHDSPTTNVYSANGVSQPMLKSDRTYGHIMELYNYHSVLHTPDNMSIPAGLVKEELKALYNSFVTHEFYTPVASQVMPMSMDIRISMDSFQICMTDCVEDKEFLVMRYAIDGMLLYTTMTKVATNLALTIDSMTLGGTRQASDSREYISALLQHAEDISQVRSNLSANATSLVPSTADSKCEFFRDITTDFDSSSAVAGKKYKTFVEAMKKHRGKDSSVKCVDYEEILFSEPGQKLIKIKFSMLNGEIPVLDDVDEFEYYSLNDADLQLGQDIQVHGFDISQVPVSFDITSIGNLPFTVPVALHKGVPVAPMRVELSMSGGRVVFTQKSVDTLMQYINKLDKLGNVLNEGLPSAPSSLKSTRGTMSAGSRSKALSVHSAATGMDIPSLIEMNQMEAFDDEEPLVQMEETIVNPLAQYLNPLFNELDAIPKPFSMLFAVKITFEDLAIIVPVHSTSPEVLLISLGQLQVSSVNEKVKGLPAVSIGYGTSLREKVCLIPQTNLKVLSSGPPSVRPSFIRKMTFEEFHDFDESYTDESFSQNDGESIFTEKMSTEATLKLPLGKLITEDVAWSMSAEPVIGEAAETIAYEHVKVTFAVNMNHTTISSFAFVDNDGAREAHTAPKLRPRTYLRYVPVCFFDDLHIHAANQVYVPTVNTSVITKATKGALYHHAFQYTMRQESKDWMVLVGCGHSNIVLSQASLSLMLSFMNTCDEIAGNVNEKATYKSRKFASPMPTNILNLRDVDILLDYEPKYQSAVAGLKKVAEAQLQMMKQEKLAKEAAAKEAAKSPPKTVGPTVMHVASPEAPLSEFIDPEAQSLILYQSLSALLATETDQHQYGFSKESTIVPAGKSVAVSYLRKFLKTIYAPEDGAADDDNMSVHSRVSRVSRLSKLSRNSRRSRYSVNSKRGGNVDEWNGAFDNKATAATVQGTADPLTVEVRLELPSCTMMLTSNVTKDEAPSMAFGQNTKVLFNMEKNGEMIANVLLSDITMVSATLPVMNLGELDKYIYNVADNAKILMPFATKVLFTSMPKSLITNPVNSSTSLVPVHPRYRYVPGSDLEEKKTDDFVPTRLNNGDIKDTAFTTLELTGAAMYVEMNVDDILMKISYKDYEHVMKCIGILTMPQFEGTTSTTPAPATTNPVKDTKNTSNDKNNADTKDNENQTVNTALAHSYGDMQIKVNIRLLDITLVNDSIPEYATPFLKVSCPSTSVDMVAYAHSQNIKVTTRNSIQYYNGTVVAWEPLLEPVTFNILMTQDALRGMKLYVNSDGVLDMNITRSMLDGVNQTTAMFAEASTSLYSAISESASAYTETTTTEQARKQQYNNPRAQDEVATLEMLNYGETCDNHDLTHNLRKTHATLLPAFSADKNKHHQNAPALSFVRLCNYTEFPLYFNLGFFSTVEDKFLVTDTTHTTESLIANVRELTKTHTEKLFRRENIDLRALVKSAKHLAGAIVTVCSNGYILGTPKSQATADVVDAAITKSILEGVFADLPTVSKRKRVLWGLLCLNALQDLMARGDVQALGSRMDTSIYAKNQSQSQQNAFTRYSAQREEALNGRILNLQLGEHKPFTNLSLDSLTHHFFSIPEVGEVIVSMEVVNGVKTISVHSAAMLVNVLDTAVQINQDILLPGGVYYLPVSKPTTQVSIKPVCITSVDETSVEKLNRSLIKALQAPKGSAVQVSTPYEVCDAISFATVENGSVAVCKSIEGSSRPAYVMVLQAWKQNGTTHIALCAPINIENRLCESISVGLVNKNKSEFSFNLSPASSCRSTTGVFHVNSNKKDNSVLQDQQMLMTLKIGKDEKTSMQCTQPFNVPQKDDGSVNINLSGTKDAFAVTLKVKYNACLVKGVTTHRAQYPRLETLHQEYMRALTSHAQSPQTPQCSAREFSAATFVGSRMSPSAKFAAVTVTISVQLWIVDATPYNIVAANSKVGFTDLQPAQREKSENFQFVSIEEIQKINFKNQEEVQEAMLRTLKRDPRGENDGMFSRATMLSLTDKSHIMLKSFHIGRQTTQVESDWSAKFNPQIIGNTVQLTLKQTNSQKEHVISGTIRQAPAPFSDTRILILSPGILVINKLPLPISVRQFLPNTSAPSAINLEQDIVLKPLEMSTFHWEDKRKPKLASFKMVTQMDPEFDVLGLSDFKPLATNTQVGLHGGVVSTTDDPVTDEASTLARGNVITVKKEKHPCWNQGSWLWSGHLDLQKPGDNVLLLHNSTSNVCFMTNVRVLMSCPDVVGAAGNAFTVIFEPYNLAFSRYRLENRTRFDTVNISQKGSTHWITLPPMQTSLFAYDVPRDSESLQVQAVRGDCSAFATFKAEKFGILGKLNLKETSEDVIDENALTCSKEGGRFALSSVAASGLPLYMSMVRDGPTCVFIFSNVKDNAKESLTLLADTEELVTVDEQKHDVGLHTYRVVHGLEKHPNAITIRNTGTICTEISIPAGCPAGENGRFADNALRKDFENAAESEAELLPYLYVPRSHTAVTGTFAGIDLSPLAITLDTLLDLYPFQEVKPKMLTEVEAPIPSDVAEAIIARYKMLHDLPRKYAKILAQSIRIQTLRSQRGMYEYKDAVQSVQGPSTYLLITIHAARYLASSKMNGLADVYAIVSFNGTEYKTNVSVNTVNPLWNMSVLVALPQHIVTNSETLKKFSIKVTVWHKNKCLSDNFLGGTVIGDLGEAFKRRDTAIASALTITQEEAKDAISTIVENIMQDQEEPVEGVEEVVLDNVHLKQKAVATTASSEPKERIAYPELESRDGWVPLHSSMQTKRAGGEIKLTVTVLGEEFEKQEKILQLMTEDFEKDLLALKQIHEQYSNALRGLDVGVVDLDTLMQLPYMPIGKKSQPEVDIGLCSSVPKAKKREIKEKKRRADNRKKANAKLGEVPRKVVFTKFGDVEVPTAHAGNCAVASTQLLPFLTGLAEAWIKAEQIQKDRMEMMDIKLALDDVIVNNAHLQSVLQQHKQQEPTRLVCVVECNGHVVTKQMGIFKPHDINYLKQRKPIVQQIAYSFLHEIKNRVEVKANARHSGQVFNDDSEIMRNMQKELEFEKTVQQEDFLFSVPKWLLENDTDASYGVNIKMLVIAKEVDHLTCYYNDSGVLQADMFNFASTGQASDLLERVETKSILLQDYTVPFHKLNFLDKNGQETKKDVYSGPHWFTDQGIAQDNMDSVMECRDKVLSLVMARAAKKCLAMEDVKMINVNMLNDEEEPEEGKDDEEPTPTQITDVLTVGQSIPGERKKSTITLTENGVTYTIGKKRATFYFQPKAAILTHLIAIAVPSSPLDERIVMDVTVSMPHIGMSMIDTYSGAPEEVMYFSLSGLEINLADSHSKRVIEFQLRRFQLDQQCAEGNFAQDEDRIILGASAESIETGKVMLHLAATQEKTDPSYNGFVFSHVNFLMQALEVQIEEDVLWRLLAFAGDVMPSLADQDDSGVLGSIILNNTIQYALQEKYTTQPLYYVEVLQIQPILVFLTFHVSAKSNVKGPINPISIALSALTGILGNIDAAPLALNALVMQDACGDMQTLLQPITQFYVSQGIKEAYKILGSIEVLGNPVSLVNGVGKGVRDFFYEPAQGLVQSPKQFGLGLARGTSNLIKGVASSVLGAASKITNSVGSGVAVFTMDEEFAAKRRIRNRKRLRHGGDGVAQGASALTHGIFSGLKGIVMDPIKGARTQGVTGFMKGMVKGVTGVVTKTASGAVDFVSLTLKGMANTFADQEEARGRARLTRFLHPSLPLQPYDHTTALAGNILGLIDHSTVKTKRGLKGAFKTVQSALELKDDSSKTEIQDKILYVMRDLGKLGDGQNEGFPEFTDQAHVTANAVFGDLEIHVSKVPTVDKAKAVKLAAERMALYSKQALFDEQLVFSTALNSSPGTDQDVVVEPSLLLVSTKRVLAVSSARTLRAVTRGSKIKADHVFVNAQLGSIKDVRTEDNTVVVETYKPKSTVETVCYSIPMASAAQAQTACMELHSVLCNADCLSAHRRTLENENVTVSHLINKHMETQPSETTPYPTETLKVSKWVDALRCPPTSNVHWAEITGTPPSVISILFEKDGKVYARSYADSENIVLL